MYADLYTLLQVPRDASPGDIKTAYHHALLRLHPDKQSQLRRQGLRATNAITGRPPAEASVDVASLKDAYRTLSDAGLRAAYDVALRRGEHVRSYGPRPAQVVSLEEFIATDTADSTGTKAGEAQEWWHGCRCGGMYRIAQCDLENGIHLVGCESCSEVIWVGYEEEPATDGEEGK